MSKIAITPNVSGTGTFTIAAPNSDTDRTLTLPDAAGAVVIDEAGGGSVKIDSSGNVGIGTSSPSRLLDVNGIAKASIFDAGGEGFIRGDAAGELRIQSGTTATTFRNNANNTEFMRIDSAGRVTKPYQPLFIGNHNNQYVSTFTAGSIIPLTIVSVNIGSHWNASTYRFTCPVSGVYECVGFDISQVNQSASLGLYKNGTIQYKRYTEEREKGVFVKLSCVTGDYLEFRIAEGTTNLFGGGGYAQYSIGLIG